MKAIFAPDLRDFVPYQQLLSDALEKKNVQVSFVPGYRRVLPLSRSVSPLDGDLFHLHFIDYLVKHNQRDLFRKLRLLPDLYIATRRMPLVYTVHDLFPTEWPEDWVNRMLIRNFLRSASALFLHSRVAKNVVCERFDVPDNRCHVVPHGDTSGFYGTPLPHHIARAQVGLGDEKICLAFGTIVPSKGIEELVRFWIESKPDAVLAIVGHAFDSDYGQRISRLAARAPNIHVRLGFQSNSQVCAWLSAANCAVLNYRTIFTSGAACLIRSWGVPLLLPNRLATIDLYEPHSLVFRYESLEEDFLPALSKALSQGPDYSAAESWRQETAWEAVAEKTAAIYRGVVTGGKTPLSEMREQR